MYILNTIDHICVYAVLCIVYFMSYHFVSDHVALYYTLLYIILWDGYGVVSKHRFISCYIISSNVISCHVMLYSVFLCSVIAYSVEFPMRYDIT